MTTPNDTPDLREAVATLADLVADVADYAGTMRRSAMNTVTERIRDLAIALRTPREEAAAPSAERALAAYRTLRERACHICDPQTHNLHAEPWGIVRDLAAVEDSSISKTIQPSGIDKL